MGPNNGCSISPITVTEWEGESSEEESDLSVSGTAPGIEDGSWNQDRVNCLWDVFKK